MRADARKRPEILRFDPNMGRIEYSPETRTYFVEVIAETVPDPRVHPDGRFYASPVLEHPSITRSAALKYAREMFKHARITGYVGRVHIGAPMRGYGTSHTRRRYSFTTGLESI